MLPPIAPHSLPQANNGRTMRLAQRGNQPVEIGNMYVIVVPIQIMEGHREEFLEALMVDAKGANNDEPGCLRFDAVQDAEDDHRIWLYEVYKDEAAFKAHLEAPHFVVFKEAADKWRVEGIQGSARGSINLYPTDAEWR